MPRRRRRKPPSETQKLQRDLLNIASVPATLLQRALSPVLSPIEYADSFMTGATDLIDDWRNWSPEPVFRRAKTLSGNYPTIKHSRTATPTGFKQHFAAPGAVVQCVRRHRRRETLFALRRTGKGSKTRYRRRNAYSEVKC